MKKCPVISCSLFLILGSALLITGLVLLLDYIPEYMKNMLYKNLALRNGTEQADRFVKPPVPVYLSFYFFNVTNMNAVNKFKEDPILQELGPYVYREEKYKEVSAWDEANGIIRYKERRTYHFEQNMTKGSLSDKINHINAVTVAIADVLKKELPSVLADFIIKLLPGEYIETHTVDELIFKGFRIEDHFPSLFKKYCQLINNCTFAFYLGKNESTGKEYEVSSGVLGMDDYTKIKLYDNKPALEYWFGERCNDLNGTDGQQFAPGVTSTSTPYVFSDDICRSIEFQYEQDVTVEDIDALQFVVPDSVFADPNKYSPNMCFCQADTSKPCSAKAGVILIEQCRQGQPVAASAPHFYQGDPEYWQKFKGLKPDKMKHDTFLNVEPLTGQVIQAAKRIQVNIVLEKDSKIPILKNITALTFFPVFWIEEAAKIDADTAADMRRQVTTPYKTAKWGLISASAVGGLILLALVVIIIYKRLTDHPIQYAELSEDPVLSSENHANSEGK